MGLGYDGIEGKSPLNVHRDTIGLSLGANVTASSYFGNSNQVFGVLKTSIKDWQRSNREIKKLLESILPRTL